MYLLLIDVLWSSVMRGEGQIVPRKYDALTPAHFGRGWSAQRALSLAAFLAALASLPCVPSGGRPHPAGARGPGAGSFMDPAKPTKTGGVHSVIGMYRIVQVERGDTLRKIARRN